MIRLLSIFIVCFMLSSCGGKSKGNTELPPVGECRNNQGSDDCKSVPTTCAENETYDFSLDRCISSPPLNCQPTEIFDQASGQCLTKCNESELLGSDNRCNSKPLTPEDECTALGDIWNSETRLCKPIDELCTSGTCNEAKNICVEDSGFWLAEVQECYLSEQTVCEAKKGSWISGACSLKTSCQLPNKWSDYHYECIDEQARIQGMDEMYDRARFHVQTEDYIYLFGWLDSENDDDRYRTYPSGQVMKVKKDSGQILWGTDLKSQGMYHLSEVIDLKVDKEGHLAFIGNRLDKYNGLSKYNDIIYGRINAETGEVLWANWKFGTSEAEEARQVLVQDDGSYVIMGNTSAKLTNQHRGSQDIFFRSVDHRTGSTLWEKQGFTDEWESLEKAVIDGNRIFFSHYTYNSISDIGETKISIFNTDWKWLEASKTIEKSSRIRVKGLGVEGKHLYVTGYAAYEFVEGEYTSQLDGIFAKLDANSLEFIWKQQVGTNEEDYLTDVAVPPGDYVYFGGYTDGEIWTDGSHPNTSDWIPGSHAIVARLNKWNGKVSWIRKVADSNRAIGNISVGPRGQIFFSCAVPNGYWSPSIYNYDTSFKRLSPEG